MLTHAIVSRFRKQCHHVHFLNRQTHLIQWLRNTICILGEQQNPTDSVHAYGLIAVLPLMVVRTNTGKVLTVRIIGCFGWLIAKLAIGGRGSHCDQGLQILINNQRFPHNSLTIVNVSLQNTSWVSMVIRWIYSWWAFSIHFIVHYDGHLSLNTLW